MTAGLFLALLATQTSRLHVDVDVRLEPTEQRMYVDVSVFVPAGTAPTRKVPIVLGEQMGEPKVYLNGQEVEAIQTKEEDGYLGKSITRTIEADNTRDNTVRLTYATVKPTGFVYKMGEHASYASGSNTDWYPSLGGRVFSADITVSVPRGQVVKATGHLVKSEDKGDRTIFTFHSPASATLSFAAGPYKVFRDDSGRLPVALYLFKDRDWTTNAVRMMRQVADTLVDWFGPYPFDEMAIVEVDPDAGKVAGFGGASLEGFLLATPGFIEDGPNLAFIGHELGHAWWGHQIKGGSDNPDAMMLTEGMAQFGSLKTVEAIDGPALARKYRTTGYPGYIDNQCAKGALALMATKDYDPPLATMDGKYAHAFADAKGFLVYDQLEQVVGTANLKKAFHEVEKDYAWKRITSKQFFDQISKSSGVDLGWFYDQWFLHGGAPRWDTGWHQDGSSLHFRIDQNGDKVFRFVTQIEAVFDDGTKQRWSVEVKDRNVNLQFQVTKKVTSAVLDPDWRVFHWDPDLAPPPQGTRGTFK